MSENDDQESVEEASPPRAEARSRVPIYLWLVLCAVAGGLIPTLRNGDMERAGQFAFGGLAIGLVIWFVFSAVVSKST